MIRVAATVLGTASLVLLAPLSIPARADIQQQARVQLQATSGSAPLVGGAFTRVQAYLSTRDPASMRTSKKANPVGRVTMTFPVGSSSNPTATGGCHEGANANPYRLLTRCVSSQVGDGWALLSNLGVSPLAQLSEAPAACAASDSEQYTRTYENGRPACTPRGFIWVHVRAYQGALVGGAYRADQIIFANENKITSLSFGGAVAGNRLTVQLPALGGVGSQAGELPLGVVLSDFALTISHPRYLRAGACPRTRQFSVSTQVQFSKFARESTPAPPAQTIAFASPCR